MQVAIDVEKGTATMTTSEFWSGLNNLLAQADAHSVGSRDEDSGYLHRDRDACLVDRYLEIGKPLWPLIERDISGDATLHAKLHRAYEIRNAGKGPLNGETPKADIHGLEYARLDTLRAGCLVQFDADHGDCMSDQAVREVKCDADGELYVECNCGKHYLGYIEDEGVVVGVYPMKKEPIVANG